MATAEAIGVDKRLTKFHLFADLPPELRLKIIHQFKADFGQGNPDAKLAPFAAIHSEWQHELEAEEQLFGSLSLNTDDIPALSVVLNQHRRENLAKVTIRVLMDDAAKDGDGLWPRQTSMENAEALARVKGFIVESVAKVLESVDSLKSTCPSSHRAGVQLFTNIMHQGSLSVRLPANHLLDCDFSQLLPATTVRSFAQETRRRKPWRGQILCLSASSLLTLFARMPNLLRAGVQLAPYQSLDVTNAPQLHLCPRLEKLVIVPNYGQNLPGPTVTMWASSWADRIQHLTVGHTSAIPDFLRSLSTGGNRTGTVAWSNLRTLRIHGCYSRETSSDSLHVWGGGDSVSDILSAIAVALGSLPRISGITIVMNNLKFLFPDLKIKLTLCSGASKLSISVMPYRGRKHHSSLPSSELTIRITPFDFWTLFSESRMLTAAANIQNAVRTHHGLHLKVVWPDKDDKALVERRELEMQIRELQELYTRQ